MQHIALVSDGTYFGQPIQIGCDLLCSKAWGYERPTCLAMRMTTPICRTVSWALAPADPGTTEGDEGKPLHKPSRHNKWCCRAANAVVTSARRPAKTNRAVFCLGRLRKWQR